MRERNKNPCCPKANLKSRLKKIVTGEAGKESVSPFVLAEERERESCVINGG